VGIRINQNVMAMNAYRNLTTTEGQLSRSLERLSSGFRINRAADDAAGLVISEGLRSQVMGLRMATRNAQDGVSVVQTAEGALTETHAILQRMRELAVQSASTGSSDQPSRDAAQVEVEQLQAELDRIASTTKFGEQTLLDGTYGVTQGVETGAAQAASVVIDGTNFTYDISVNGTNVDEVEIAQATYTVDETGRAALEKAINDGLVSALAGAGLDYTSVVAKVEINEDDDLVVSFETTKANTNFTLAAGANNALDNLGITAPANRASQNTGGVFQVGSGTTEDDKINIVIAAMDSTTLGVDKDVVDVSNADLADPNITAIDAAITAVSTLRGNLGAYQNRFERTISNLSVTTENLSASESRIRDTDMAAEMMSFTRAQILQQAGTAMLAQANAVPQSVLQLLQ
jgi:flagellin